MQDSRRQVAKKVRVKDLTEGKYVRVEGEWEPNYVETPDGRTFSRVNVLAVVATEPVNEGSLTSFVIDDGSGRIPVRVFEGSINAALGDVVLLIGRPRQYGEQMYIVPEITKRVDDNKWIELRKLELAQELGPVKETEDEMAAADPGEQEKELQPEPEYEVVETSQGNTIDKVLEAIKQLDSGEGADAEEVLSNSGMENAQEIVDNLLREGEIFEVRSGRLKILD